MEVWSQLATYLHKKAQSVNDLWHKTMMLIIMGITTFDTRDRESSQDRTNER